MVYVKKPGGKIEIPGPAIAPTASETLPTTTITQHPRRFRLVDV